MIGKQVGEKGDEEVEAGNLFEHAKAAIEEEAFGPWVLVSRKRQVGKSNKKDKAHFSFFWTCSPKSERRAIL